MNEIYQVIIIGGGPAGLTAGLYCSRSRLNTLLLEKEMAGGQMTMAELLENYPGFPAGISGIELAQLMHQQAVKYGLEIFPGEVIALETYPRRNVIRTTEGDFVTECVIIASGSRFSKLGVSDEDKFVGRGVSYCATCDGPLFKGKEVVVVGGGDTALNEALHLSKFASSVTVVHRRDQFRASKILQERALVEPRIKFIWNSRVCALGGDNLLEQISLKSTKDATISLLPTAGLFVAVGAEPNTGFLQDVPILDEQGYVITNESMETQIPGILAAGDVRHKSIGQVITAAGDGAVAAVTAEKFLG
ncbi:MAG: thioredoxin-disulfide reductase [Chloroflexota bacterium]|nr:thioredoxin-disulfide reductase [Chloroflexota bacterium]